MPPIAFAPSAFVLHEHSYSDPVTPQHPSQALTGFIPAGVYLSGTWRVRGTRSVSGSANPWTESLAVPPGVTIYATGTTGGAYDTTFAASPAVLAAINAGAGTLLAIALSCAVGTTSGLTDSVNLVTLDLVPPPTCTYALDPTGAHYGSGGGAGTFDVLTDAGCAWSALENAPAWLHLTGPTSGTGPGTLSYTVDANPGPSSARLGTISVVDQVFTVTEDGAGGSGTGGVSVNSGHPFPHNEGRHLFMTIGFPNGYQPGLDLNLLCPGMDELQFISVRPRSGYIGTVVGHVLSLTDTGGSEIAAGTACGPVDIWRFRIAG
jgi:hypothetical protein